MMEELKLDQPSFAALAKTTKSVVNQWLTGKIKTIGPEYAYNIAKESSYCVEWILLGRGPKTNKPLVIKPKSPREKLLDELAERASRINEIGIAMLIGEAKAYESSHPVVVKETVKFSQ